MASSRISMALLVLLVAASAPPGALAAAPPAMTERLLGLPTGKEVFLYDGKAQLYVTKQCVGTGGEIGCNAGQAVRYTHFNPAKAVEGSLDWGRNPESYACRVIAHGDEINAILPNGNELCVCGFKDGSKISCGALIDYHDPGPKKDRYRMSLPLPKAPK